ncbi:MAG: hypothetical protein WA782_02730 [Sulfitobacter sp.]
MTRSLTSLLLAFLLAVTSQSMAVARGAAAATGQMVICHGSGTMTVYTDAEGAPTMAPHICPECVAGIAFSAPPTVAKAPSRIISVQLPRFAAVQMRAAAIRFGPPVRGPPLSV